MYVMLSRSILLRCGHDSQESRLCMLDYMSFGLKRSQNSALLVLFVIIVFTMKSVF